ncbi:MAG: hypothetical protein J7L23_03275 [Candidatus Diapherotrites archaeon]|nr:hypothetical protein [Candidatus Diapherotrites archaeon]
MRKGYIGPLGDDFPALLPIALGLLMFFSAISLAYAIHDAKSTTVNLMRANVMISRSIREDVHFTREYWTGEACSKMNNTAVNYGVKVAMRIVMSNYTYYSTTGSSSIEIPSNKTEDSVMLVNSSGGSRAVCPLGAQWEDYVPASGLAMSYPVVVDSQGQILPATLVVVTWQ